MLTIINHHNTVFVTKNMIHLKKLETDEKEALWIPKT